MIPLIATLGISLTIIILVIGLFGDKKRSIRRASFIFFPTIILVILLTVIDFNNINQEIDKETLLVAYREAPLGGLALTLYADSTFHLINFDKYELEGVFRLKGDTIFISSNKKKKYLKNGNNTAFIIKKNMLIDVGNSGIVFLDLKEYKLKK
jgi:hypothetical protein